MFYLFIVLLFISPDACCVISAWTEAGCPSIQAQHLRGIWTGQLWRPVHQRAHPAHTWWRVSFPSYLLFFASLRFVWRTISTKSFCPFVHCRDVVKKIDQSEFEGFEYINPLLMSAEECVWDMLIHTTHTHTHTYIHARVTWRLSVLKQPFCLRATHAQ